MSQRIWYGVLKNASNGQIEMRGADGWGSRCRTLNRHISSVSSAGTNLLLCQKKDGGHIILDMERNSIITETSR